MRSHPLPWRLAAPTRWWYAAHHSAHAGANSEVMVLRFAAADGLAYWRTTLSPN